MFGCVRSRTEKESSYEIHGKAQVAHTKNAKDYDAHIRANALWLLKYYVWWHLFQCSVQITTTHHCLGRCCIRGLFEP